MFTMCSLHNWNTNTSFSECMSFSGSIPGEVNHTTIVRTLVSLTSVLLTWFPPEENNPQITGYNITYCPSANNGLCEDQPSTTISVPAMQPTAVLVGLIPVRRYRVYIRAENDAGLGPQPAQPYFFDSTDEGMSCLIPGSPFWSFLIPIS